MKFTMAKAELPWPRSLHAAAAVDDLARGLYHARCRYFAVVELPWEDVPQPARADLLALAGQTLRSLGPAPRVIGTITPALPCGDPT